MSPRLLTCVLAAASNAEFVAQWSRLRGISLAGSPIEKMIDQCTGHSDAIAKQFIDDVRDLVHDRIGDFS